MRKCYQLLLFVSALLTLFIYVSCRKLDDRRRNLPGPDFSKTFFQLPLNAPSPLKRVAETIKAQDSKFHFINDFVKKQGIARWDRSVLLASHSGTSSRGSGGGEDSVVLIPLVRSPFASVHGFLACVVGKDSVKIRLFDGSTYPAYGFVRGPDTLSAAYIAATTMILNHRVFGDSVYHITDNRLFNHPGFTGNGRNIIINDTADANKLALEITTTYCLTIEEEQELLGFRIGVEICQTTTEWIEFVDPILPTGMIIPNSGGGGESCGGSWWCQSPCRLAEAIDGENPCGNADDDLGWVPEVIDDDRFNPYVYDEVRIDPELRDSFPCIASLIEDTLFNINQLTQVSMHDHFTINQYNHTYFTINWGFTCDTGFNAWTRPRGVATQINGQTHWTDTIELNPCFLRKASKEKIVAVLMHETIHAYILWCIKEYNRTTPAGQGAVDSNYLKQHFPLHWEYLIAKPWNHNNAHELMARNYVRFIADVVFNHSNPNAPEELRRWLAMNLGASGLRNTSAWGNAQYLTDTCSILAIDLWSNRFQGWPNIINYQPGPGCPLTDTLFRDSLQMMKPEPCQ